MNNRTFLKLFNKLNATECCAILSIVLFIFNYCFVNDNLMIIGVIVACLCLLKGNKHYLIPNMILFSFFSDITYFEQYNLYVFISIAGILSLAKYDANIIINTIFLLIIYILSHFLSANSYSLSDLIPFFNGCVLLFFCFKFKNLERELCIEKFFLGFLSSGIFGILRITDACRLSKVFKVAEVEIVNSSNFMRFSGLAYDCNYYGILCLIVIAICLFGFGFEFKNKYHKYIILSFSVLTGLFTISKSFYFALLFLLLIYFIISKLRNKIKIIIALMLVALPCCIYSENIAVLMAIASRFNKISDTKTLTTGRSELWYIYSKRIFDSFETTLVGHGKNKMFASRGSHNTFIEIPLKYGLFGCLYESLLIFFSCNFMLKNMIRPDIRRVGIIFIFFAELFTLNLYTFRALWCCIFILLLMLSGQMKSNKKCNLFNKKGVLKNELFFNK